MKLTTSLSTTKAEYRVLTDASKDIHYFQSLFEELRLKIIDAIPLFSNNQSCIKLMDNLVLYLITNHIKIQRHFIREVSKLKNVHVSYIPTIYQQAYLD